MVKDNIHAGQLNYQVELFEKTHTTNATGEAETTLSSLGFRFAKRSSVSSNDDDGDGRVVLLNTTAYIFRYEPFLIEKKSKIVIRDFTGDYHVNSVEILANGRKRFLELKGMKRE